MYRISQPLAATQFPGDDKKKSKSEKLRAKSKKNIKEGLSSMKDGEATNKSSRKVGKGVKQKVRAMKKDKDFLEKVDKKILDARKKGNFKKTQKLTAEKKKATKRRAEDTSTKTRDERANYVKAYKKKG